jgi:transposase InsO family protein
VTIIIIIGADLFQLKDSTYLVVVDYYSRYMEIQKLTSTTSAGVISALKGIFSRHGIPVEFMSDNGPQFASQEMKEFAERYCFTLTTTRVYIFKV